MIEFLWRIVAWIVSRDLIRVRLLRYAMRRQYGEIRGPDGSVYMRQMWVLNPFPGTESFGLRRFSWLPFSIRVHHICREDADPHPRDHPWNFRSIVLWGGYREERLGGIRRSYQRGDTNSMRFGEFHRISSVKPIDGAVTLFITGRKQGTWGFHVAGVKVPCRDYLAARS